MLNVPAVYRFLFCFEFGVRFAQSGKLCQLCNKLYDMLQTNRSLFTKEVTIQVIPEVFTVPINNAVSAAGTRPLCLAW